MKKLFIIAALALTMLGCRTFFDSHSQRDRGNGPGRGASQSPGPSQGPGPDLGPGGQ